MRTARLMLPGLALLAGTLGCCALQKTAGICDCNPPAVESVLLPTPRPTPMSVIRHSPPAHHHAPEHHLQPGTANPVAAPASVPVPGNPQPAPVNPAPTATVPGQPSSSVLPPITVPAPSTVPESPVK